jgi:hypothetical protein
MSSRHTIKESSLNEAGALGVNYAICSKFSHGMFFATHSKHNFSLLMLWASVCNGRNEKTKF